MVGVTSQIAPQVERVGLIYFPEPPNIGYLKSAEAAAPSFNKKLVGLEVHSGSEIENVVATFATEPHCGLIIAPNVVSFANSDLIIALAARYRMPAIYPFAFYAKAGGLVSYGFDAAEQFRQGAGYVDRLLKGAKPADLPVQHPSKFVIFCSPLRWACSVRWMRRALLQIRDLRSIQALLSAAIESSPNQATIRLSLRDSSASVKVCAWPECRSGDVRNGSISSF
jgi:hypothetical protein